MAAAAHLLGADVEVVKRGVAKSAIDLSGLRRGSGAGVELFVRTLEVDLRRSGWFVVAAKGRGGIAVLGSCDESGGEVVTKLKLMNTATSGCYFSKTFREKRGRARRLAHVVADEIVWAVKKRRGIASTQIVMIGSVAGRKNLYVCDADGGNLTRITKKGRVCIAPTWGADGKSLFYTSFHGGYPDVYEIDLTTHRRRRVAAYPGLNVGADISGDGRSMVLTLSKDGNPDLYVLDLGNGRLSRLTRTRYAAEASPSWSPDGRHLVYVSDKSGSPQLYVAARGGGKTARITFRGSENVAPDWGPDGRIAYSSKRGGRYQICVMDPNKREVKQVTSQYVDHEDPSWARNGRHIVCSRTVGYSSDLYVLDTMGDEPIRLTTMQGSWYSPAWSPR